MYDLADMLDKRIAAITTTSSQLEDIFSNFSEVLAEHINQSIKYSYDPITMGLFDLSGYDDILENISNDLINYLDIDPLTDVNLFDTELPKAQSIPNLTLPNITIQSPSEIKLPELPNISPNLPMPPDISLPKIETPVLSDIPSSSSFYNLIFPSYPSEPSIQNYTPLLEPVDIPFEVSEDNLVKEAVNIIENFFNYVPNKLVKLIKDKFESIDALYNELISENNFKQVMKSAINESILDMESNITDFLKTIYDDFPESSIKTLFRANLFGQISNEMNLSKIEQYRMWQLKEDVLAAYYSKLDSIVQKIRDHIFSAWEMVMKIFFQFIVFCSEQKLLAYDYILFKQAITLEVYNKRIEIYENVFNLYSDIIKNIGGSVLEKGEALLAKEKSFLSQLESKLMENQAYLNNYASSIEGLENFIKSYSVSLDMLSAGLGIESEKVNNVSLQADLNRDVTTFYKSLVDKYEAMNNFKAKLESALSKKTLLDFQKNVMSENIKIKTDKLNLLIYQHQLAEALQKNDIVLSNLKSKLEKLNLEYALKTDKLRQSMDYLIEKYTTLSAVEVAGRKSMLNQNSIVESNLSNLSLDIYSRILASVQGIKSTVDGMASGIYEAAISA